MVEVKSDRFAETARTEAERVMGEAERRAEGARADLGEALLDAAGEYFPEAARARRRRDLATGAAAGAAVGAGIGFLAASLGRR